MEYKGNDERRKVGIRGGMGVGEGKKKKNRQFVRIEMTIIYYSLNMSFVSKNFPSAHLPINFERTFSLCIFIRHLIN